LCWLHGVIGQSSLQARCRPAKHGHVSHSLLFINCKTTLPGRPSRDSLSFCWPCPAIPVVRSRAFRRLFAEHAFQPGERALHQPDRFALAEQGAVVAVQTGVCVGTLHDRFYHRIRHHRRQRALAHQTRNPACRAHRCSAAYARVDARKMQRVCRAIRELPLHVRLVWFC